MFTVIHGSHLYGLNTPASDMDYKSVYLPTARQVYTGKFERSICLNTKTNSKEKNSADDVDHTVYALHEFVRLLAKGDMVAIDMLHATKVESHSSTMLELFGELKQHRHLFYCKDMNSFMGYVRSQAAKYGIKGSRLAFAKELATILAHNQPVKDCKLDDFRDILPECEYARKLDTGYELFGSLYQWTGWYSSVMTKCSKMINEYGHRAKLAEQNQGVDWKALSHSLRAAYQLQSIFNEGDIVFPFQGVQRSILMQVKAGLLPYKEVAELIEDEMLETERAAKACSLPQQVNEEEIDNLLYYLVDACMER
jgi:hypothetical protein